MGAIQGSINQLLGTAAGAATLANYQLGKSRIAAEARTDKVLEKSSLKPEDKQRLEAMTEYARSVNNDTVIGNLRQIRNEEQSARVFSNLRREFKEAYRVKSKMLDRVNQQNRFKEFETLIKDPSSTPEAFELYRQKWGNK